MCTLSINIKYPYGGFTNEVSLIDTVSLLESTIVSFVLGNEPLKSDLLGTNDSKFNTVDKFYAKIYRGKLKVPIN